jgi:hypothetical protein
VKTNVGGAVRFCKRYARKGVLDEVQEEESDSEDSDDEDGQEENEDMEDEDEEEDEDDLMTSRPSSPDPLTDEEF